MAVTELDAEHASTTTPASRRTVDFSLGEPADGKLTPTEEWSRRVRSVGGYIQVAFAALWLVRGGLVIGGGVSGVLIALSGVAVIAVLYYAIRLTAGTAPRPKSKQGKRLERDITVATVLELVAAFALPVLVSSAGHSDWVLPSIAITIGPLLLYLDHRVHIPRYRPVGWLLTIGPVILVATMSGTPLVATTGIASGVLLLGTAAAGFHDLAGVKRRAELAGGTDAGLAATTGAAS
jgi:hypothetical protein